VLETIDAIREDRGGLVQQYEQYELVKQTKQNINKKMSANVSTG
jgi:protein tyrosine phosphatase